MFFVKLFLLTNVFCSISVPGVRLILLFSKFSFFCSSLFIVLLIDALSFTFWKDSSWIGCFCTLMVVSMRFIRVSFFATEDMRQKNSELC